MKKTNTDKDTKTKAVAVSSKETETVKTDIKKIPAPTPIPRPKAAEAPPTSSEPTPPTPPTSTQPAPAPAPPASSEPAVASVTSTTSEPAQRVVKKNEGTPKWLPGAIIGGIAAIFLLLLVGLVLIWNATKSPTPPVASTDESAELIRLKAEMEALMEALREQMVTPPAPPQVVQVPTTPAPEPSIEVTGAKAYNVPTFNPTTLLQEVNSRNVPRITRVERHVSPNGAFYLLFGKDPNSGKERIITAGGDTVTLLEPDWDVKRPQGRLVILENPPRGLTVPQGRYIVSVME